MKTATRFFDFFFAVLIVIAVTGGTILSFPFLKLDLATLDTWPILLLVLLLATRGKVYENSKTRVWLERFLNPRDPLFQLRALFVFIFGGLLLGHIARHWGLSTDGYDVSFVHQALFNPFGPPFFPATIFKTGSALGGHLLFSLVPLSLITEFVRMDEFVFLVQAGAIGFPLYFLLTRGPLKDKKYAWIWAAVITLSFRSLRSGVTFDFREDAFAYLGMMGMILSLISGRVVFYFLCLLFAVASKENIFLYTTFFAFPILGASSLSFSKKTRWGLAVFTVLVSATYGLLALKVIHPYFAPTTGVENPIVLRLAFLGSSPFAIFKRVFTDPSAWVLLIQHSFSRQALSYGVRILLPVVPFLLSREALLWLIPALAGIGVNVLSGFGGQTSFNFHYDLVVFPALMMALFTGMRVFLEKTRINDGQKIQWNLPAITFLFLALAVSDKWPWFHVTHQWPSLDQSRARLELLKLDRHDSILVDDHLSAQLSQHLAMKIQLMDCTATTKSWNDTFNGYVVLNVKQPREALCLTSPAAAGARVKFANSEVAILDLKK